MCYSASSLHENFLGVDGFLILRTNSWGHLSTNAPWNATKRQGEKRLPSLFSCVALRVMFRHSLEEAFFSFLRVQLFLRQGTCRSSGKSCTAILEQRLFRLMSCLVLLHWNATNSNVQLAGVHSKECALREKSPCRMLHTHSVSLMATSSSKLDLGRICLLWSGNCQFIMLADYWTLVVIWESQALLWCPLICPGKKTKYTLLTIR